jgi:hypothetical protein
MAMPKKKKRLTPKEKEKPYNPEDTLPHNEEGGLIGLPPAGDEGDLPRDTTDDFLTEAEREAFKGKRK